MVSIVVPVYNTSQYLQVCVDSLLNQTYQNIEIILIDDGSTDSTPQLCDSYAALYERIKVIHQVNQGTEIARKTGVDACSGEYVMFVDSDDSLEPDTLDICVKEMKKNNVDIVCFNYCLKGKAGFCITEKEIMPNIEAIKNVLLMQKMDGNLPCKLYKTTLVRAEDVLFRNQRNCDILTVVDIMLQAKKVMVIPYMGYQYRFREESQSHSNTLHPREEEYVQGTYSLYNRLSKEYPEITDAAEFYWLHSLLYVFIHMEKETKLPRNCERYKKFKENIEIKRYLHNKYFVKKPEYIKLFLCYFGLFRYIFLIYQKIS